MSIDLYNNPIKYSGAWNFGPKKGNIISVKKIVKKIIKYWGTGKYKIISKKLFYEQENLQLNIKKSNRVLKWFPRYSVNLSIKKTVEWYKFVHLNGPKNAEKITRDQIISYLRER